MTSRSRSPAAAVALALLSGCYGDLPDPSDADDPGLELPVVADSSDPADVPATDAASPGPTVPPDPLLNEVSCGDSPWVELHLRAGAAADLAGWRLTSDPADWRAPGFVLDTASLAGADGAYVVVTPVGLEVPCGAAPLWLVDPDGALVDDAPPTDAPLGATWARLPDGEGPWGWAAPTPGAANQGWANPLLDATTVAWVEILASNAALVALVFAPGSPVPIVVTVDDGPGLAATLAVMGDPEAEDFRGIDSKPTLVVTLEDETALGLATLHLDPLHADQSVPRAAVLARLARDGGARGPGVGQAYLRVAGDHYGLYALVEPTDAAFVARHFDGAGDVVALTPDHAAVTTLHDVSDATPDDQWIAAMEPLLDLPAATRAWAAERYVGLAPTLAGRRAHRSPSGRLSPLVPGVVPGTFDATPDPFADPGGEPLWTRCRAIEACRALFEAAMADVSAAAADPEVPVWAATVAAAAVPHVRLDPRREHDFNPWFRRVQEVLRYVDDRAAEVAPRFACLAEAPDADEDGASCAWDCDDTDPVSWPGAAEVCDDGVDQDCNGVADDRAECVACAELWRGDHRYLDCLWPRTFEDARAHCQAQGADLAVADTPGEAAWLLGAAGSGGWVGLVSSDDTWSWIDGAPADEGAWATDHPKGGTCATTGDGGWVSKSCTGTARPLCEDPCAPGEDGDGDGHGRCDLDCDDADPDVSPDAADLCFDGLDQDCSGVADDGPACASGCTVAWRGPHRYLVCPEGTGWHEARAACQAAGSDLVILDHVGEATWVSAAAKAAGVGGSLWIGLSDHVDEGEFVWWDGTPPTAYSNWNGGEPNDWGDGEDCTEMHANGRWNDLPCTHERAYVCEDVCAEGEDADGDGHARCGADCDDDDPAISPDGVDTCDDGLDQDCSGAPDDAPGCPPPCVAVEADGGAFHWCAISRAWVDAAPICEDQGMTLARFDHLGQALLTRARLVPHVGPQPAAWIGLSDITVEGTFVWPDGSPLSGPGAWAEGEPNNNGEQDCVQLHGRGSWDDLHCLANRQILCRPAKVE